MYKIQRKETDFFPGSWSLDPPVRFRWAIHGPHSHGTGLLADRERDGRSEIVRGVSRRARKVITKYAAMFPASS